MLFYKTDSNYKPIKLKDLLNKRTADNFYFNKVTSSDPICNKYDNHEYVPFEWDYVRLYANDKQKIAFNKFRRTYIKNIIIKACNKKICELKPIGSDPKTVASDADFDMYGQDVDEFIGKINKDHHKYFKKSMDVIFDINIYGTIADIFIGMNCAITGCVNHIKNIDKQHQWAFIRAAEYLPIKLVNSLSNYDKTLYVLCKKQIKSLGKHPDNKKYIIYKWDFYCKYFI